jgi:GTP pyrophosphokinase
MAKDIRVIIIKLADRLHNMRTLEALPPAKRKRIAQETRDVYAPLAHRLGIYKAKTELEDLALKHLQPEVYVDLARAVKEKKEERESYIKEIAGPIKSALLKDGIKADVYGRAKHLDSIHHKIVKRGVPFDQIYDLIAIRVIVQNERECYHAMGILHAMWKPVAGRFHDYIANPKLRRLLMRYDRVRSAQQTVETKFAPEACTSSPRTESPLTGSTKRVASI